MSRKNGRFKKVNVEVWGSLVGEFRCSYRSLLKAFGKPNGDSDGYKVSTEWIVKDTMTGRVFRIYDWKATKLYDSSLPSVSDFRARESAEWHVGSEGHVPDIKALLNYVRECNNPPV